MSELQLSFPLNRQIVKAYYSPRLRLDFAFENTGRIVADRRINTHSVLQAREG